MVRKKVAIVPEKLLTEVELEIIQIVWAKNETTVKDVVDALPAGRDLAYTSVATILKILEKKGFLSTRKTDRAHVYFPLIKKHQYESKSVHHLIENLFEGTPSSLVMKLINESDLSHEDLKKIKSLLNERLSP